MKKLFILGTIIATFFACSVEESPKDEFHLEILPIESVTLPTEVQYGETYTVNYSYYKPSSCYIFNDLYYLTEADFITVAVINKVIKETNGVICESSNELIERSFDFHCDSKSGTYTFKFWQGEDETGLDKYLVYEVPIIN